MEANQLAAEVVALVASEPMLAARHSACRQDRHMPWWLAQAAQVAQAERHHRLPAFSLLEVEALQAEPRALMAVLDLAVTDSLPPRFRADLEMSPQQHRRKATMEAMGKRRVFLLIAVEQQAVVVVRERLAAIPMRL